ncbi:SgrR family transcriptional regulator [Listeria ivanovii]|uniref:SgrR family transcriptional regulator n=2 Tax=Listeria ivanovii TaxID=1638 RepID=A0ABS1G773_LISIV|nr:ABC transporter substrate-binding protein [Listeria ivanovii]EFR96272.1 solute-binding family 5 protein [Listeria ivanovii FSL F6-596]AIS60444.1 ABC transporter substrate-binding protein [Listeria ivanovii subsp. londoniensis]AIS63269.1 ABC transporter substrate-binding protein [Listeria ivanovii subsp. londoniensis]MBK1962703.1 SgrR family transcriptional regulator [Listeria ivanovii subsp. londoniensis]MBK1967577.1 SgrR family transcriptional regulator [Listeria ivanovii subsp. londoniens
MDKDYFIMRAYLYNVTPDLETAFKLSDLANIWFCTSKNAKRKLQQYQSKNTLHYAPGLGRGNLSKVTFPKPLEEEVLNALKKSLSEESFSDILFLSQLPIPKSWFASISNEIQQLFGLQITENQQEILRSIIRRKLTTLDPLQTSVSLEAFLLTQIGDTLVKYDKSTDKVIAHIAHHWKTSADYREWTFYLRKSVLFHHGRTLDSEDVKFTLLRAKQPQSVSFWQTQSIQTIDCTNKFTLTIRLKKPDPFFSRYLCSSNMAILPRDELFDEYKWISTGPFRMVERSDERLILEAFDGYFLTRPLLDRVEFWTVENSQAIQTTPIQFTSVDNEGNPAYVEHRKIGVGVNFLCFNGHRNGVAQHKAFREAIYHLLDCQKARDELFENYGTVASNYYPEKSIIPEKHPEKIPALLKKANYQGEEVIFGTTQHPLALQATKWICNMAAKFDIHLVPKIITHKEASYSTMPEDETDMMMMGEIPSSDGEVAYLDFLNNPFLLPQHLLATETLREITTRLEKMKLEKDAAKRDALRTNIDKWLTENYHLIYLHHPERSQSLHSMIKGISENPYGYFDLSKVWIETKPSITS